MSRLPALVSTIGPFSVGTEVGSIPTTLSSAAWPAANRAIHVPLYVPAPATIVKLWWLNGAAVSGNVDCGLYRASDLSLVVSSGAVAQSGTSAVQEFDIADTTIPVGVYLLALAMDNGTGQMIRFPFDVRYHRVIGITQQASAYPLPATAVPAVVASAYVPMFGLSLRTLVA
jgi:hypothetical protein